MVSREPSKALMLALGGLTNDAQLLLISEACYRLSPDFPITGINLIPNKVTLPNGVETTVHKVYINDIGATWLVHHRYPPVMSIETTCVIDAFDNDKSYARYRCRITYADGSVFIGEGSAQPTITAKSSTPRWQVNEMAETRAKRRTGLMSCASMLIERKTFISEDKYGSSVEIIEDENPERADHIG